MPILAHFGLLEYPFRLTQEPRMFFGEGDHAAILQAIDFALGRGDGLLKVVGEIGTGKTMIARMLAEHLGGRVNVCYLAPPVHEGNWLPSAICRALGIATEQGGDATFAIEDYLRQERLRERRTVLIVDEAQALDDDAIETLRLLGNLELKGDRLLQVILLGQPELDRILAQSTLRPAGQRVSFSFETRPISLRLVPRYVRHRLACASELADGKVEIFTGGALRLLARLSRGVPRVIHLIADKALFAAYADGVGKVGRRHVVAGARELAGQIIALPMRYRHDWGRMALLACLGLLSFASGVLSVWVFGPYLPFG
ncbi:MAG: ExeA family protein [Alphaproteobacteria bacterium]|nr:ExeA family protein [Alphaproteobacteria bacterium]